MLGCEPLISTRSYPDCVQSDGARRATTRQNFRQVRDISTALLGSRPMLRNTVRRSYYPATYPQPPGNGIGENSYE